MIHYCFHFFVFSFSCRKDREVRRKQRSRLLSEENLRKEGHHNQQEEKEHIVKGKERVLSQGLPCRSKAAGEAGGV